MIYCRLPARTLQTLSDEWKFQDNFAKTAGQSSLGLKNFTVTLFQLYTKDGFNALLQWCRAFRTAKSQLKNRAFHFAKLREIKIKFFFMFYLIAAISLKQQSHIQVVGTNLEIPFCTQPYRTNSSGHHLKFWSSVILEDTAKPKPQTLGKIFLLKSLFCPKPKP